MSRRFFIALFASLIGFLKRLISGGEIQHSNVHYPIPQKVIYWCLVIYEGGQEIHTSRWLPVRIKENEHGLNLSESAISVALNNPCPIPSWTDKPSIVQTCNDVTFSINPTGLNEVDTIITSRGSTDKVAIRVSALPRS